jgi:hypothetical protein
MELGPLHMELAPQQTDRPEGPKLAGCPDSLVVSLDARVGTAVALRDRVTGRWAAGNETND